jgi:hypothetical protein
MMFQFILLFSSALFSTTDKAVQAFDESGLQSVSPFQ